MVVTLNLLVLIFFEWNKKKGVFEICLPFGGTTRSYFSMRHLGGRERSLSSDVGDKAMLRMEDKDRDKEIWSTTVT